MMKSPINILVSLGIMFEEMLVSNFELKYFNQKYKINPLEMVCF